mgnify:CR=1 FL=1
MSVSEIVKALKGAKIPTYVSKGGLIGRRSKKTAK